MEYSETYIGSRAVGTNHPTYFIADLASNHGGNLEVAKELIREAASAGADAAKFQHFKAHSLVSDRGFQMLGPLESHQLSWEGSVFETYELMEVPEYWTEQLAAECKSTGIEFMTAPYDLDSIPSLDKFLPAYKVGSGDITFHESILSMAIRGKPLLIATGASTFEEVKDVISKVSVVNPQIILMQCNTNYSGSSENSDYANIRTLEAYKQSFPNLVLGLSDHTHDDLTTLAAVSLGARVIEKHFKGRNSPKNPDLEFSLNAAEWAEMVTKVRRLERALGDGIKVVEENERVTRVLQRRSIRYAKDFKAGHLIEPGDIEYLRPAPENTLNPSQAHLVIGKTLLSDVNFHDCANVTQFQ